MIPAKEKAMQIVKAIFEEQHNDDGAKMILLSTPKIAMFLIGEMMDSIDHVAVDRYERKKFEDYWAEVGKEVELL